MHGHRLAAAGCSPEMDEEGQTAQLTHQRSRKGQGQRDPAGDALSAAHLAGQIHPDGFVAVLVDVCEHCLQILTFRSAGDVIGIRHEAPIRQPAHMRGGFLHRQRGVVRVHHLAQVLHQIPGVLAVDADAVPGQTGDAVRRCHGGGVHNHCAPGLALSLVGYLDFLLAGVAVEDPPHWHDGVIADDNRIAALDGRHAVLVAGVGAAAELHRLVWKCC